MVTMHPLTGAPPPARHRATPEAPSRPRSPLLRPRGAMGSPTPAYAPVRRLPARIARLKFVPSVTFPHTPDGSFPTGM